MTLQLLALCSQGLDMMIGGGEYVGMNIHTWSLDNP